MNWVMKKNIPNHPRDKGQSGHIGSGPVAVCEEPQRGDRVRRPGLHEDEEPDQAHPEEEGDDGLGIGPPVRGGPHEAVDHTGHAEGAGEGTGDVEPTRVPLRVCEVARDENEQDEPDGKVDEEHPPP